MSTSRILLIGYGNPGRRDDGLGPALASAVENLKLPGVSVEADYQLTVEDAVAVAEHDVVVFADADAAGPEPFSFRAITPVHATGFSSHGVEPQEVLGLAEEIFGRRPEAYLLGIRGYDFEPFEEKLTTKAARNLCRGLEFLVPVLKAGSFQAAAGAGQPSNQTSIGNQ